MGFGGSTAAMIQTLKSNKTLLGQRYTYFDARKDYSRAAKGLKIGDQKATPEQLKQIKAIIRSQKKKARIRGIIVLSVIIPILIFGLYLIFRSSDKEITQNQIAVRKVNLEKYQFYIDDGDYMISKEKWNNAIFQYTRASEILPNEYDVQYRLALAYTYKCKYTKEACEQSDSLVNRLLEYFPNNEDVKGLRGVLE